MLNSLCRLRRNARQSLSTMDGSWIRTECIAHCPFTINVGVGDCLVIDLFADTENVDANSGFDSRLIVGALDTVVIVTFVANLAWFREV